MPNFSSLSKTEELSQMSSFWWQPNNIQLLGNILGFEAVNKTAANKQLMRRQTSQKKLTMSRQHKSGAARFIPSHKQVWARRVMWQSVRRVNGELESRQSPAFTFRGILKENKNRKGQKSSSNNEWARCEAKAQSVRVERLLLTRRICCHVSQADGCSPRCRASFLWWAAGSCDAPASVCRCSSASWPGATSTNTTHTRTHTLAPQHGTIHHQLNCCSAGVTASVGKGGGARDNWHFHATRGIVKKKKVGNEDLGMD